MLRKLSTLPVLIFLLLSEPLQALAQQTQTPTAPEPPRGYDWPGPWHMWSDGYGWHWGMGFAVMLFCAVVFMAMMFSMMRGGMMHRHRNGRAIDLLKERFARGEINQTEYEERKRVLET